MVGTWFQEFPWTKNKEVYDLQSGHAGGFVRGFSDPEPLTMASDIEVPFSGRAFPQKHSDQ